jgi:hypothetical protein
MANQGHSGISGDNKFVTKGRDNYTGIIKYGRGIKKPGSKPFQAILPGGVKAGSSIRMTRHLPCKDHFVHNMKAIGSIFVVDLIEVYTRDHVQPGSINRNCMGTGRFLPVDERTDCFS